MSMFQPGDLVVVTGDSQGAGHEFVPGTQGVVEHPSSDGTYKIQGPDDYWWVYEADLRLVGSEADLASLIERAERHEAAAAALREAAAKVREAAS